jgi:hypothetical protein
MLLPAVIAIGSVFIAPEASLRTSVSPALDATPLVIHSALYGNGPLKVIDVTARLQAAPRTGLVFLVSNDVFGCDPDPGRVKELNVEFSYQTTEKRQATASEGTLLVLPERINHP